MKRSEIIKELNFLRNEIVRTKKIGDKLHLNAMQNFDNFLVRHGPEIADEISEMFAEISNLKLQLAQKVIKSKHEL